MRCSGYEVLDHLATCAVREKQIALPVGRRKAGSKDAFTLLEVVVGLILMATVLVGSMLSFSSHQRQLAVADKRIAAVSFADDLLSRMTTGERRVPQASRGTVPTQPTWFWETSVVGTTAPMDVPMVVVRLRVFEIRPDGDALDLVSVDVVEPIE